MFGLIGFAFGFVAGATLHWGVSWAIAKFGPAAQKIESGASALESKVSTLTAGVSGAIKNVRAETASKLSQTEAHFDGRVSALEKAVFGKSLSPTSPVAAASAAPAAASTASNTGGAAANAPAVAPIPAPTPGPGAIAALGAISVAPELIG